MKFHSQPVADNTSWSNSGFGFANWLIICFCMKVVDRFSNWYSSILNVWNEELNLISGLNFTLILPSNSKVDYGYRFCPFVLPQLEMLASKFEAFQLSFCFSRRDCSKGSVSLLLAVEQVFSSGSSVETRNWWSCAGVDFLGYMTKNAAWCENSAAKFMK